MVTAMRTALFSFCLFVFGCQPQAGTVVPPLTPDVAKAAILELIYSGNLENMHTFPIGRYQTLPIKLSEDGKTHLWGKYEIHLEAKHYEFAETREEEDKRTRTMWRGTFTYYKDHWVASIPKLLHTTED